MTDNHSGAELRQFLIDNKLLRPNGTHTEVTRYRGTLGAPVVTLDDAGRRAAQQNVERGRRGSLDHGVFVPESAWRSE